MYISHKQEGSMFSLLLHLWKYGIAKFLLFLLSVVEHPFWSLGMSFSFLSSGLFPRLSFPSVFFVLFFLSPFAFRLFSPYLCSAGGRRACAFPLSFSFPFLARRGLPAVRECPCWSSIRPFRLAVEKPLLRRVLRLGVPSGIQQCQLAVAVLVLQALINSFGEQFAAGFSAANKIDTFAFMPINVWEASTMIGVITFGISLIGVYLGKFMGQFVGKYADILGGGVLILIGTKILLQHLGIIGEF